MTAKRIENMAHFDDACMCYWRTTEGWLLYIPGCGAAVLSLHTVQEHGDGTITVKPSIRMRGHSKGKPTDVHGYLTKGIWRYCQ